MKVAPQYRAGMDVNGFNTVVLQHEGGYFQWTRGSLEELYLTIREEEGCIEVLAIYPDINSTGMEVIERGLHERRGKGVDWENLLRD